MKNQYKQIFFSLYREPDVPLNVPTDKTKTNKFII